MAAGLINESNVILHLDQEIESVSYIAGLYELNSTKGESYRCEVAVIAAPLDELNIHFTPGISIPERKLQHTFTTFVRGCLNPVSSISIVDIICLSCIFPLDFVKITSDLVVYLARNILVSTRYQTSQNWLAP